MTEPISLRTATAILEARQSSEVWYEAVPSDTTGERFDSFCRELSENTTVHLGPGLYWTYHGFALKPGCRMLGAGWQSTTVKQVPTREVGGTVIFGDVRRDGCNEVSDLTIDGSFSEMTLTAQEAMHGLSLYGSHNNVQRVRVLNFGGTWEKSRESFGIAITGAGVPARDVAGAVIRDCIVEGGRGTYENGIIVSYGAGFRMFGGLVQGNTVRNMLPVNGDYVNSHCSAFGMHSGLFTGNTAINCQRGYYSEGADCLTISGNSFLDCRQFGLLNDVGPSRHLTIERNVFDLGDGATAIVLRENGEHQTIDTKIIGNVATGGRAGFMLPTAKKRGQTVAYNTLESASAIAPDAVCYGNRAPNGGLIVSLPDRKGKWKK